MMRQEVTSVDNRVPEGFVWSIDTDLGTDTPAKAFNTTRFHLIEMSEIIFNRIASMSRSNSLEALVPHLTFHRQTWGNTLKSHTNLLLLRVVSVGFARFDHLDGVFVQDVEVI